MYSAAERKQTAFLWIRCTSCTRRYTKYDASLEAVESEFRCSNSEQRPDTAADSDYFQHTNEATYCETAVEIARLLLDISASQWDFRQKVQMVFKMWINESNKQSKKSYFVRSFVA